jgi:hypothetical protein
MTNIELQELLKQYPDELPIVSMIDIGVGESLYVRKKIHKNDIKEYGAFKFACHEDHPGYEAGGGYVKESCIFIG